MIAAPFDYKRANTLDEALTLLAQNEDAKILAGGHSLIPAMKLRLGQPPLLIDLGRIKDLSYIREENGQRALAVRGALLYLEVLAIPVALCGLYWGGTTHWIKKLIDLIVATILSQLVITMLMVLAAADLNNGQLSGTTGSASVGTDMTT